MLLLDIVNFALPKLQVIRKLLVVSGHIVLFLLESPQLHQQILLQQVKLLDLAFDFRVSVSLVGKVVCHELVDLVHVVFSVDQLVQFA